MNDKEINTIINDEINNLRLKNRLLEAKINEYQESFNDDYKFIKAFTSITLAKVCRIVGANRTTVSANTCSKLTLRRVRKEIERELYILLLGDSNE